MHGIDLLVELRKGLGVGCLDQRTVSSRARQLGARGIDVVGTISGSRVLRKQRQLLQHRRGHIYLVVSTTQSQSLGSVGHTSLSQPCWRRSTQGSKRRDSQGTDRLELDHDAEAVLKTTLSEIM